MNSDYGRLGKGNWTSLLGPLLMGQAQAAYRALAQDKANDYQMVKCAILYCCEICPELYQQQFWATKKQEQKKPRILA